MDAMPLITECGMLPFIRRTLVCVVFYRKVPNEMTMNVPKSIHVGKRNTPNGSLVSINSSLRSLRSILRY